MGIYYSENVFMLQKDCVYCNTPQDAWEYYDMIRTWAGIWGELAAPHVQSIVVACDLSDRPSDCKLEFSVCLDRPTEPVSYEPDPKWCSRYQDKEGTNAWVLALIRPHGTAKKLTGLRLQVLLAGLANHSYPNMDCSIPGDFAQMSEEYKVSLMEGRIAEAEQQLPLTGGPDRTKSFEESL